MQGPQRLPLAVPGGAVASSQTLAHLPSGMVQKSCSRLIDSRRLCNLNPPQNEKHVGVCFYGNRGGVYIFGLWGL